MCSSLNGNCLIGTISDLPRGHCTAVTCQCSQLLVCGLRIVQSSLFSQLTISGKCQLLLSAACCVCRAAASGPRLLRCPPLLAVQQQASRPPRQQATPPWIGSAAEPSPHQHRYVWGCVQTSSITRCGLHAAQRLRLQMNSNLHPFRQRLRGLLTVGLNCSCTSHQAHCVCTQSTSQSFSTGCDCFCCCFSDVSLCCELRTVQHALAPVFVVTCIYCG